MNDTCYFAFDLKKLVPTPPHPQKLQFGHGVVNPAVSKKQLNWAKAVASKPTSIYAFVGNDGSRNVNIPSTAVTSIM